jgi:hypothetical protein
VTASNSEDSALPAAALEISACSAICSIISVLLTGILLTVAPLHDLTSLSSKRKGQINMGGLKVQGFGEK